MRPTYLHIRLEPFHFSLELLDQLPQQQDLSRPFLATTAVAAAPFLSCSRTLPARLVGIRKTAIVLPTLLLRLLLLLLAVGVRTGGRCQRLNSSRGRCVDRGRWWRRCLFVGGGGGCSGGCSGGSDLLQMVSFAPHLLSSM